MIKRLVTFGDSFVQGVNLEDPSRESIPACVARRLGLELDNHGDGGCSLMDTLTAFKHWLEQDHYCDLSQQLVLVGLTDSNRESFKLCDGSNCRPIPGYLQDSVLFKHKWPELAHWTPFLDFWFRYLDIDHMAEMRYWVVTTTIGAICQKQNIPYAFFDIARPPESSPSIDSKLTVLPLTYWAFMPENKHRLLPCLHTNPEANELYSEMLTTEIKQRKLV